MKTKSIALVMVLLLSVLLAACGGNDDVTLAAPPTVSLSPGGASPTISSTPVPTALPSATIDPNLPTDTTVPKDEDLTLGDTFAELGKNSDLVVRGKFIEKLKEPYNLIRDMNDPELPDEKEKTLEWQFIFEVTDVFKTPKDSTIKKGDKITVNLAYEDNNYMTGYKAKPIASYFEPDLNQDLVLFLNQNTLDESIYYREVSPFYFEVKDDLLYAKSNTKSEVESFEKKMKLKSGEGAPVANLKKDLGVK